MTQPLLTWGLSGDRFEFCNDKDLPEDFKKYWNTQLQCQQIIGDDILDKETRIFRTRQDGEQFPNTQYHCNYSNFGLLAPSSTNEPSQEIENKITQFLTTVMRNTTDLRGSPVLVQFWASVTDGEHNVLTVREQPFAICSRDEGLFRYRMMCEKYTFSTGDGLKTEENDLGLIGRVFSRKLPESSPNVEYYFSKEYPQRDDALRCNVSATSAVPVLESMYGTCVGVLEFTTTLKSPFNFLQYLPCHNLMNSPFPEVAGFQLSDAYMHSSRFQLSDSCMHSSMQVQEINEVLRLFCVTHKICYAQAWALCRVCEGAIDGNTGDVLHKGQLLSVIESANINHLANVMLLSSAPKRFHTVVGHGVVGAAASCHDLVFCRDVTQFSPAEYPFAHYARSYGLKGCFGICLPSSYFGSFVLEIFISESYKDRGNLETLLRKMLETLKPSFQNSKHAYGENWTKDLPIKVIDFHYGVKFEYVLEPEKLRSWAMTEALPEADLQLALDPMYAPTDVASANKIQDPRDREEITEALPFDQLLLNCVASLQEESFCEEFSQKSDPTYRQTNQVQAAQDREAIIETLPFDQQPVQVTHASQLLDPIICQANVASGEQNETIIHCLKPKGLPMKSLKRPQKKTGFQVGWEDLQWVAKLKASEAAMKLGVSTSTFKRICRENNIERWPPRGVNLHELTSSASSSRPLHQISDVTTVGEANEVTIKAKCANGDTIKFLLSLSSGLVDLQQQVAKRLKLEPKDYTIKYKDKDDELILLACDEDLLDCVSTFKSKTWIEILLVPT